MKFDREPDGKFLSCADMISTWLPALLDTSSCTRCIGNLLRCAAVYCDDKAAQRLEWAAAAVRRQDGDWANRYINRSTQDREVAARLRKAAAEDLSP